MRGEVANIHADPGANSAAAFPVGRDDHPFRLHRVRQIVRDAVGHCFIKDAFVSEALVVQLETFEFDAALAWAIPNGDGAKVGMPRDGTNAGELIAHMLDYKIPTARGRWKTFKKLNIGHL